MVTNEIKRLNIKLGLLQKEGCWQLIIDVIDMVRLSGLKLENENEKLDLIQELEFNYKQAIKNLGFKDSKQQKLFE